MLGALKLVIDGSLVLDNKYLIDALKDPDLKYSTSHSADNALEAIQQGYKIVVDWQEPQNDGGEDVPPDTEWLRIIPRTKPEDTVYFVTEDGRLSSSSSGDRSEVRDEYNTIIRPAVLFESERRELQAAITGKGWPCKVEQNKIVVDLLGQTLHLSQQHIQPRPIVDAAAGRIKVRRLKGGASDGAACQPMSCSSEAS